MSTDLRGVEGRSTSTPFLRRRAVVLDTVRITPRVVRVTLGGPALDDLPVAAPDGYLKLFFPTTPGLAPELPPDRPDGDVRRWYRDYLALPDASRPPMRTYTLRRRRDHVDGVEIDVDFVLHAPEAVAAADAVPTGPGERWAAGARPGDQIVLSGPYGLHAPRPEHDAQLLVGDETAVPAISAIVEALPAGARAEVVIEVASDSEVQHWRSAGRVEVTWVHRDRVDGGPGVLAVVRAAPLPGRRPYVWLAGEASTVRDVRRHLTRERGVDKNDITFCGYWRRGRSEDQAAAEAMAAADRGEVDLD